MFEIAPAAIRPCRHHVYSAEPLCLAVEITGFQEQWSDLPEDVPDTFAKHFKGAILASVSSLPAPSMKHSFSFAIYLFYCTAAWKTLECRSTGQSLSQRMSRANTERKGRKTELFFSFAADWLGLSSGKLNDFAQVIVKVYNKYMNWTSVFWILGQGPTYEDFWLFEYSVRYALYLSASV